MAVKTGQFTVAAPRQDDFDDVLRSINADNAALASRIASLEAALKKAQGTTTTSTTVVRNTGGGGTTGTVPKHALTHAVGGGDDVSPASIGALAMGDLAAGDLGNTYPDPTVVGIQGVPVDSTPPADGDVLIYSVGSGQYSPGTATGLTLPTVFIEGCILENISSNELALTDGGLYVPAAGTVVNLGRIAPIDPNTGGNLVGGIAVTLAADTLYYVCIDPTGLAALHTTTSGWSNYAGRSWADAAGNRYVGSFLTDGSANIVNFQRHGNLLTYQTDTTAAPFVLTTTLATAAPANVSVTAVVPGTASRIQVVVTIGNPGSGGSIGFGLPSIGVVPTATTGPLVFTWFDLLGADGTVSAILDVSGSFSHMESANSIRICLQGYYDER